MNQKAVIVAMIGSTTSHKSVDPVWVLNSVCREGWELVNDSFVFVEQGQQSRDKFMASGQNIAVRGKTVGYYLFKRCEANRRTDDATAAAEPQSGYSLDAAQVLFERGEIIAAADVMRQLSADAQDSGNRQSIEAVEDAIRQMRGHLVGPELSDFDNVLRFGFG